MHGQMKRDEIEWLYVLFWKCVVRLPPCWWWNPQFRWSQLQGSLWDAESTKLTAVLLALSLRQL